MSEFLFGLASGALLLVLGEAVRLYLARRSAPELSFEVASDLALDRLKHPCAYARVRVKNRPGRTSATGVTVRIESVDGGGDAASFLPSWNLAWAGADRGNSRVSPTVRALGPGEAKEVDVAHLNAGVVGRAIIDVRPQPGNNLNYIAPGTLTLHLIAAGENTPPCSFAVRLTLAPGEWDGSYETASSHLTLEMA